MLNVDFYRWVVSLAINPQFLDCITMTERKEREQYHVELVLRFFASLLTGQEEIAKMGDMGEFLTRRMYSFAEDSSFDRERMGAQFTRTFDLLDIVTGDDTFRRYDQTRGQHVGGFSISAFEVISTGVAHHLDHWAAGFTNEEPQEELRARIQSVWSNPIFQRRSGSGVRGSERLPYLVPLGISIFAP